MRFKISRLKIFVILSLVLISAVIYVNFKEYKPGTNNPFSGIFFRPRDKYASPLSIREAIIFYSGPEHIKKFLENGADVNEKNVHGETPLHLAASSRGPDLLKLLIKYGADVNAKTDSLLTPLMYAAFAGNPLNMKFLIDHGADVKAADFRGNTALHHMAINCSQFHTPSQAEGLIKEMIDRGADVNARNEKGNSPLHEMVQKAACGDNNWIKKSLILFGADINSKNEEGRTPLHLEMNLLYTYYKEDIEWLIEKGAKIDASDNKGETPLHLIAAKKDDSALKHEIMQYLIDKGANVNAEDNEGMTPLHLAVMACVPGPIEYLLRRGADAGRKNRNGQTIYDLNKECELPLRQPLLMQNSKSNIKLGFSSKNGSNTFYEGDFFNFQITTNAKGYLQVIKIDLNKKPQPLFPDGLANPNGLVQPGVIKMGLKGTPPFGQETIVVFLSSVKLNPSNSPPNLIENIEYGQPIKLQFDWQEIRVPVTTKPKK